jgi:dihydroorotate dehydrogenase (NAD+) catalytic subunit
MPDLRATLGRLRLCNPTVLASGTVGYGPEYASLIDYTTVGAIVTKTITPEPRAGNAPPRLKETPGGLLNAIGLENVGLERFLSEKLREVATVPAALIASVAGFTVNEYAELTGAVTAREEIDAVELNISCPNVERARRPVWDDPEAVAEITRAARATTEKTLLLKLSPNTADILSVAEAGEAAGADALVVANTLSGMRIDVEAGTPSLGNTTGGLSGRALLPVNLANVWKIAGSVSIPIVGSGGIADPGDALEYILAGASAVQIGTALFADPEAPGRIVDGLAEYMRAHDIESIEGCTGLARKEKEREWQRTTAD